MTTPLRVLILEDRAADAELIAAELRRSGFDPTWQRVETEADYCAALDADFEIILADYRLPQFDALRALELLQARELDLPFIIVSGAMGEELAVAALRQGAADYLLKDRLARLGQAITGALQTKHLREERRKTELAMREGEASFRLLFASNPHPMWVYDTHSLKFLEVNETAIARYGYSREEFLQMRLSDIRPPEEVPRLLANITAERPLLQFSGEWRHRLKDGRVIDVEITSHTLEFGEHSAALVVAQDITLRKQAERALQVKNEELKGMSAQLWQAAKLATMGELAASIAHELNNPLTTVNLHLEHLLGQMSPENLMRGSLQVMAQELERMSILVANLLAFSRRSQPQISTVDMGEEIDTTLELIHYHLRNHRIHVERHYASERPHIQADRQQLRQLFLNLFTNAIDAMPQGGTLTISMRAEEAVTPSHVVIEIVDTGFGMASEEIPKALEPFYTTKSEGKGTGLGLPICRRIIEEHHGTLRITSDRGKGTAVQIAFPLANAANAAFLRAL